ncbi:MAG: Hint domain-containing protein, partial [Pseudomonadota bacterium]
MRVSLAGVIFDRVRPALPDAEEVGDAVIVELVNAAPHPIDISGWQVWSDAPDIAGRWRTVRAGTTMVPGGTIHLSVVKPQTPVGARPGSLALVDPVSGGFVTLLVGPSGEGVTALPGFPGTACKGTRDGRDAAATTDDAADDEAPIAGFAPGTRIATPGGAVEVEKLRPGHLVETLQDGPRPVRMVIRRDLDFTAGADETLRPVEVAPGSLRLGRPMRRLLVAPEHRLLVPDAGGCGVLLPAKAMAWRDGIQTLHGQRKVCYLHIVLDRPAIVFAEGAPVESLAPGEAAPAARRPGALDILPRTVRTSAGGRDPRRAP